MRRFPLEIAKQNVLQSINHTVTIRMTVKVNSEIYTGSLAAGSSFFLDTVDVEPVRSPVSHGFMLWYDM